LSSYLSSFDQFDVASLKRFHVNPRSVSAAERLAEKLLVQGAQAQPMALEMLGAFNGADAPVRPIDALAQPGKLLLDDEHVVGQVVSDHRIAAFDDVNHRASKLLQVSAPRLRDMLAQAALQDP
jgi:hypothetical protein